MTVRMERHLTWLVLWVLLALQAGCKEQPKPQPPPPPKVTVAQPVQQAVTDSLDLTGNTQAIYTVQLVARGVGNSKRASSRTGRGARKGSRSSSSRRTRTRTNPRRAGPPALQTGPTLRGPKPHR